MRNLIVYSTKHGTVVKCIKLLTQYLNGETQSFNVEEKLTHPIDDFDNVILGGSIYAGMIQKKLKHFMKKHMEKLLPKNIYLFVCSQAENEEFFSHNFPVEIYNQKIDHSYFGSEMDLNKLTILEKIIVKTVNNNVENYFDINENNIKELAEKINLHG